MFNFLKLPNILPKKQKDIKLPEKRADLVRRSDKLDDIKKMFEPVQPACVVIEGKAGVGKSFFIQTLIDDLKQDHHFVIFRKIEHSENEKIVFVLGELAFRLEDDIKDFAHWSAKEEKVIEATEAMLKWAKSILKMPEEIPVEKIPSILAGIEKEKYERGFIHEFKDTLNKLIKYIPSDKRMVLILDQVERIDPKELNLLYDIMEEIPERTLLILVSKTPILTSEIIAKIYPKCFKIENFSEKETEEMLKLSGIPFDKDFLKKFYRKYKGYPLLQGMALNEMKSKQNYDLDSLPENLEHYFEHLLGEISAEDLQIIWTLSVFRECIGLDDLCKITKKDLPDILSVLSKEEIAKVVRANHCYELFHSLFSEFVCKELEKISEREFRDIQTTAAEYYANKLQKPDEIGIDKLVFALVEAPYHASKAKSPKLLELIKYSSQFKTMWGYLDEAKEEFETACILYQKNNDKKGISSMISEIGRLYYLKGKTEEALKYYMKALAIDEELNDIRGRSTRFNNIGILYQDWGKPEQALEYYNKALEIDEELNDIRGKSTILNNIGRLYQDWGKPEQALEYFTKALEIQPNDFREKSTLLNNIGRLCQDWGKPEQALEYYNKALEIDEELNDLRGKSTRFNNIGRLYQDWGKPEQALEYFTKSLGIADELKDLRLKATRLNNIGILYKDWAKPEQALEYYNKALEIDEGLNDTRGKATSLNNIGTLYKDWGKPKEALGYFEKALKISKELRDIRQKAVILNNIGTLYQYWGKLKEALKYHKKALKINEELKDIRGKANILSNIGLVYYLKGKKEEALKHFKKVLEIDEELKDIRGEAISLSNIGGVYQDWNKQGQALECYQKSLALFEKLNDIRRAEDVKKKMMNLK